MKILIPINEMDEALKRAVSHHMLNEHGVIVPEKEMDFVLCIDNLLQISMKEKTREYGAINEQAEERLSHSSII